ncbi:hypothetical protein [Thermoanaerobacterium sp. RBIITD]|uniref:hypothetical protein n=1 Tax=Thermoanaerobacterium sp. RBIITD TaxID=1550240 RepID=UPI001E330B10|nr:hypothetical protein [Thermoanaerobacterium sp. RBIITD]
MNLCILKVLTIKCPKYDYYQKKKESKPKKVALGAIMHKISDIVFAVLRDNKPFVIKTPDEHKLQYQNIHKAA